MNNNCIVVLLNNQQEHILNFRKNLELLFLNYLQNNPCNLVCFHESNFPIDEIEYLKNNYSINFIFQDINFKVPEYPSEIMLQIPKFVPHPYFPNAQGFGLGYRHMCRFFSGEMFKHPILQNYQYVWRLDTDSFILQKIDYNVFDRMKSNDSLYGYINIQHDHIKMLINLWETCEEYFNSIDKNHIFQKDQMNLHFCRVFYTNFEIFNLEWFKSKDYQDYYEYIDKTGGIYIYRWGDHAIRYLGLNSLVDKKRLLFFNDIVYQHQKIYHNNEILDNFGN
jgi:hypothetical protein